MTNDAPWGSFIDMHVHLPAADPEPMRRFEALLDRMFAAGMTRVIVNSTLHGVPDRWHADRGTVLRGWDRLRDWTAEDARRAALGLVLPAAFTAKDIEADAGRMLDEGAVGFKVVMGSRDEPGIHPNVFRLSEFAAERGAPILFHTFLRGEPRREGELVPADVVEVAGRVPGLAAVVAHAGADYRRALPTLAESDDLSVDISGCRCYLGMLDEVVRWLGADRVLFGSDAYARGPWSQLAKLENTGLSETELEKVRRSNAERLFFGGGT